MLFPTTTEARGEAVSGYRTQYRHTEMLALRGCTLYYVLCKTCMEKRRNMVTPYRYLVIHYNSSAAYLGATVEQKDTTQPNTTTNLPTHQHHQPTTT